MSSLLLRAKGRWSSCLQMRYLSVRIYSRSLSKQASISEEMRNKNYGDKGASRKHKRKIADDGITFSHFIQSSINSNEFNLDNDNDNDMEVIGPQPLPVSMYGSDIEISSSNLLTPPPPIKFHLKTYGCQMNVSDSEIVRSILLDANMIETTDEMEADVLFTNTCAIRENAESKIWHRLQELRAKDRKYPKRSPSDSKNKQKRIIAVLGCMGERLKEKMFEKGTADLIAGPDAYRDLPRLVSLLMPNSQHEYSRNVQENEEEQRLEQQDVAINVQLSLDETYADIKPVRTNPNDVSAFVSIMRGCNNMCSYCVVPFTRGRERSRDFYSIIDETRQLVDDHNLKEVILLGQNVNSYHDKSSTPPSSSSITNISNEYQTSNPGFSNMFRLRGGAGFYFTDLVAAVSDISDELRVRFTSPHPKDYPPELLELMASKHNVCNQLHMPAQSGNTKVLERMRRGYSREAYMQLIEDVWDVIPDVAISSDFISGFCGETEEEHLDTLSLMQYVKYEQAFMFAYSMRGKTHAHRKMKDDVEDEVKKRRLNEVIEVFRSNVQKKNEENEIGRLRVVLVEGVAKKKSTDDEIVYNGRTDQNKRIIFPTLKDGGLIWNDDISKNLYLPGNNSKDSIFLQHVLKDDNINQSIVPIKTGDYVVVEVNEVKGHILRGRALCRTTLKQWKELSVSKGPGEKNLSNMLKELCNINESRMYRDIQYIS